MQHDLHVNPNQRTRRAYPFVVELQADIAEGDNRLIAPLAPPTGPFAGATSRAIPQIDHDGSRYVVALPLISSLPRNQLRIPVGSIASYRDDITRALDWLFFGI